MLVPIIFWQNFCCFLSFHHYPLFAIMATVLTPPKPSFFDHGDRESTKSRSSSLKDFAMRSKRAFTQPMTALLSNKENRGNKTTVQTLPSPPQTTSTSAGPTSRPVVRHVYLSFLCWHLTYCPCAARRQMLHRNHSSRRILKTCKIVPAQSADDGA